MSGETREALATEILEASADPIFLTDLEGRYLMANPTCLKVMGCTLDEAIGRTAAEIFGSNVAAKFTRADSQVIKSGTPVTREETVTMDGATTTWSTRKSPHRDADGNTIGLVGIARDISERKSNEEALRVSEEQFQDLFNSMREGFASCQIILDEEERPVDYRFLKINPAFEEQAGMSVIDSLGKTIKEIYPDIEPYWIERYGHVAVTGEPMQTQDYNHNTNRWYDVIAFSPSEGKFAMLFKDITERKRAEDALQQSEERFKAIYEYAPVLINAFDESGNCVLWNEHCRKTFGWTIEEINAHEDALAVLYPDPAVREEVRRAVTTDPNGRFREWHPITKDGKVLSTMWANFRLPDGLAFSIGYDTTERERMAYELLKMEKLESIGVLAGGIAHDLNNYLTGIVGNIGLAKMHADPAEKDKRLEIAEEDAMRVKELTQRLLTFAKGGLPV